MSSTKPAARSSSISSSSVMDNYRRRLTDEELMLEDRAAGVVDDIRGIATGRCGS